jgi:hypothetical protein
MPAKTKDRTHPIFVPLTEKEHDALAKAAQKESRSTRAHAAHLLTIALGLVPKTRTRAPKDAGGDASEPAAPEIR